MSKPRLQIIRGLPGSGKTTLAIRRYPFLMRIETDMFFYREGAYRFTMENNMIAVDWFRKAVRDYCAQEMDFVATGVFAAHTERLSAVIETALGFGYEIYINTLTGQYGSVHAVPDEHMKAMRDSFVPDAELAKRYEMFPDVRFGLMPTDYPLEHLKGKEGEEHE